MTGALPPNSRCTRFKLFDAASATSIPARTEPVIETIPGVLCVTIDRPVSRSPQMTLSTPGGKTSPAIFATRAVDAGVVSLGFKTVVFPAAIAGMNFQTPIING
ncbi:unannotated protein [freshwater metagenome]|uniref:Unannotated protein n=1 Tax=freshwater metagenome TaxID=449393 RepID=A0A6J6H9G4_9ZZZZ